MSFRSGFFNSKNHDKQYYASDISKLFNSLINPGVFGNVGNKFIARPGEGMQVIIPSGMAWFNSTWTLNDSDVVINIDEAPYVAQYSRIDAIFLRIYPVDDTGNRDNDAYYVKGTETSATPVKPAPTSTDGEMYIPICYITVAYGATSITAAMIENCVGVTETTPFVTGILETVEISELLTQWQAQWNDWMNSERTDFDEWFETIKDILDEDTAGHLQNEIDEMNSEIDELKEVEYTSSDTELNPTTSETVALLTSGETAPSRWTKVSKMFKNIRYCLKQITQINNDLTEVKGVKGFLPIFGTTTGRGAIVDALQVDLNSADGSNNKVGYVYTGYTNGIPSDCSHGIREVLYYNPTSVYVKITGIASDGHPEIWMNAFNGTTWNGWCRFSSPFNHVKTLYRTKVGVPGDGRNGVFTLTTNQRSNTIYCLDIFVSARLHNTGVGWGTPVITTDGTVLNQSYNQQLDEVYTGNGYYWVQGGTYITLTMAGLPANNGNWDAYLILRAY